MSDVQLYILYVYSVLVQLETLKIIFIVYCVPGKVLSTLHSLMLTTFLSGRYYSYYSHFADKAHMLEVCP